MIYFIINNMLFNSPLFIFLFLPVLCLVYFLAPEKFKFAILLIFNLLFYFLGGGKWIILLIFLIILNYFLGRLMQKNNHARIFLFIGIIVNLAILTYFKLRTNLPLGISFFTFQVIAYLIDVYRKNVTPEKNAWRFVFFVSFFPYVISGPITRYKTMSEQLKKRRFYLNDLAYGAERFIIGMAKKVLLANQLSRLSNISFAIPPDNLNFVSVWLGAISFMAEIYFDFSGYSDMAIGLAQMFGFRLEENFNQPYRATSVKDFWRRWHISLSTWLRDYVYIPLGGNRKGKIRANINILIVFLACGLWHGTKINFIVWGAYYGLFFILENIFLANILQHLHKFLRTLYALIIVAVGWVIFRSDNLTYAFQYLAQMFFPKNFILPNVLHEQLINYKSMTALVFSLFVIFPVYYILPIKKITVLKPMVLIAVLISSIIILINTTYNPFIYFRF